jgi:hypothetical protein
MNEKTYTMEEIERLTREHAADRRMLAERVAALNDDIRSLQRRRMPGLRNSLAKAQDSKAALVGAIAASDGLFEKPKSVTVEGIKVGYAKSKGRIDYDDGDQVVRAIRKKLPEEADALIKVNETPVKGALGNLTAAQLKAIGCRVVDSGEHVVVKPQDGELDKLVAKLMADEEVEA